MLTKELTDWQTKVNKELADLKKRVEKLEQTPTKP